MAAIDCLIKCCWELLCVISCALVGGELGGSSCRIPTTRVGLPLAVARAVAVCWPSSTELRVSIAGMGKGVRDCPVPFDFWIGLLLRLMEEARLKQVP